MRDKYGAGQDPYCYPDSDVLVNKLNIRDEETLVAAEIEFTTLRYKSYTATTLGSQEFTLEHLQRYICIYFRMYTIGLASYEQLIFQKVQLDSVRHQESKLRRIGYFAKFLC